MKLRWDQSLFLILVATSCTCRGLGGQGAKTLISDQRFNKDNMQSWNDWMAKRNLGSYAWRLGEISGDKFQNWQDWMYKRRFGSPATGGDFSGFDKSKFQEWKDWISKRSTDPRAPFPGFNDLDKHKFQQWDDWISKRSFGSKPSRFEPSFGSGTGFQNWAEYVKRQNLMVPSSELANFGSPYFQNWRDLADRMAARDIGDNFNDIISKRQLGLNGDRYDSFRRYFTNGLQDWRTTFKGAKRGKNEQKADEK